MQYNFANACFNAHVIISFMQQLEFISFDAQGIKFIYVVDDSKWIFAARHSQPECLPLTLKSFNLVFSFTVVDRVSREKFASVRGYISVRA